VLSHVLARDVPSAPRHAPLPASSHFVSVQERDLLAKRTRHVIPEKNTEALRDRPLWHQDGATHVRLANRKVETIVSEEAARHLDLDDHHGWSYAWLAVFGVVLVVVLFGIVILMADSHYSGNNFRLHVIDPNRAPDGAQMERTYSAYITRGASRVANVFSSKRRKNYRD